MNYNLLTKYSENLDYNNILKEYPRPQLKRNSYINLNGIWKYEISKDGDINGKFQKDILVPFCIESSLSKVRKELKRDEYIIYKKEFNLESTFIKNKTIIHFSAVDQMCEVYLNGNFIGENKGGYLPFWFNISDYIKENNVLIVKVKDELNVDYPYGKQAKKRGGMWYTPVSGIWGSVWLESVNENYIKNIKLTPNIDENKIIIDIDSNSKWFSIVIKEKEKQIYKSNIDDKHIEITIDNPKLWSPDNPFLYDLFISSEDDEIESYFAMRKFGVDDKVFLLNNKPYFVNGVLDQGYFSDGIYTPSSYEVYKDDILKMKELGFNTLRKHIKIEPMMFYYYCDLYGMLVFQDMVNLGKYSFFRQTALPTIGFKKMIGNYVTNKQKENFIFWTKETVKYLYNIPSIVCYTIFNEGWGQFDADKLYKIVKKIDSTRVVDTTSGWFKKKLSDVESLHVYFKKIKLKKSKRTIFVSEFGGYSYKIEEHSFNKNKTYGYRKYDDREKFEEGIISLYRGEILSNLSNGLAGTIYTQVSDVEDETNGFLTYDRKICKVNEKKINDVMKDIYDEFNKINN